MHWHYHEYHYWVLPHFPGSGEHEWTIVHLLHTVLLGNDLQLLRLTSFKGFSCISVFLPIDNSLFLFIFNLIINIVDRIITSRITMTATTTGTATATAVITTIVNQVS